MIHRSRVSRKSILVVVEVVAEVMPVFQGQLSCDSRGGIWQADHLTFEGFVGTSTDVSKYLKVIPLISVAQLVGHCPAKHQVTGLNPSQGQDTCLGCEFSPQLGCAWEATDVSLSH